MFLKLGMEHLQKHRSTKEKIYKIYVNDDPGLALKYFTARST